jgi:hypothetical protein
MGQFAWINNLSFRGLLRNLAGPLGIPRVTVQTGPAGSSSLGNAITATTGATNVPCVVPIVQQKQAERPYRGSPHRCCAGRPPVTNLRPQTFSVAILRRSIAGSAAAPVLPGELPSRMQAV